MPENYKYPKHDAGGRVKKYESTSYLPSDSKHIVEGGVESPLRKPFISRENTNKILPNVLSNSKALMRLRNWIKNRNI